MAPSHFGDRAAQDQQMPADGRDNEAQPLYRTTDAAVATITAPHIHNQGIANLGTHHHLSNSFSFPRQLPHGLPPTIHPRQGHGFGYGFNGMHHPYTRFQQNPNLRPVRPPQSQPAWMYQLRWTPSTIPYGAVQRQHLYDNPYASSGEAGAFGNPRSHISRPLEFPAQLNSFANPLNESAGPRIPQQLPHHAAPAVQEWPTWNLASNADSQRRPDIKTKTAQEQAQQPVEQRLTQATLRRRGNTQPTLSSIPATTEKRKLSIGDEEPFSTLPPPFRHSTRGLGTDPAHRAEDGLPYRSQYPHRSMSESFAVLQPQQQSESSVPELFSGHGIQNEYGQNELHSSSASYGHDTGSLDLQHCPYATETLPSDVTTPLPQHTETSSPAKPILKEGIYQAITDKYEDYKWSIKLYELRPDTQFDFAHTYMDDWFEKNIFSSQRHKWHCHTTKGFIKGGNRFSMLLFHNAADPFTWNSPSETTTSIAFYGRSAHTHEEFRWTTITPWIPEFLAACTDFTLRNTWDCDMTKATDRRFHRAYWLAANMLPLGNLLNHCPIHEKPHDEPEPAEIDEKLTFTKEDLQCQWIDGHPSAEHCQRVWQRILDEVEHRDVYELGSDHIAIGGTEREYESEL